MKYVYVLCNNDMLVRAYTTKAHADAEATARHNEAKREARSEYPTAYWHVHTVELAP